MCVCVWVCANMDGNGWVCVALVCLWTASLYIYWNEQLSLGLLWVVEASSHASVYRLSRIRAWQKQALPSGSAEVTRSEIKFRRGERGELSRAQIRGRRRLTLPEETWKCVMTEFVFERTITFKQSHQTSSGLLRQKLQLRKYGKYVNV